MLVHTEQLCLLRLGSVPWDSFGINAQEGSGRSRQWREAMGGAQRQAPARLPHGARFSDGSPWCSQLKN